MIGAYSKAPQFAWSGWRLRIPGEPAGGQYHGFIGPDSLGWHGILGGPPPAAQPAPWDDVWGGTALSEGQNLSDYVVRGPAEIRPRPNASGGVNVVSALQTKRTPGYGEAPGNYVALGYIPAPTHFCSEMMRICGPDENPVVDPYCGPTCIKGPGATSIVLQPPPPTGPGGTIVPYTAPPTSPAPAPTVSSTPTTTDWFSSSTIIPGVENVWLAGAAALALAYFALRGHK